MSLCSLRVIDSRNSFIAIDLPIHRLLRPIALFAAIATIGYASLPSACNAQVAVNANGTTSASVQPQVAICQRPVLLPQEVAEVEIALGKLRLVPDRFRIVRKHEQFTIDQLQVERMIQVSTTAGRPALRLAYQDVEEKWNVNLDPLAGCWWERTLRSDKQTTTVEYNQMPGAPIHITVTKTCDGAVQSKDKLTASTLWHLTEQNSPVFTQHVVPALKRLNPAWDLPDLLATAKRMRAQCLGSEDEPCGQAMQRWIADLESSDHSVRASAIEKLRSAGLAAHQPLEKLAHQPLSAQQRSTINELLAELEPRTADTPTRLAYWLSGDPTWR